MAKKIAARILVETDVDGVRYKPDQAVAFDPSVAKRLKDGGQIDPHPDAVKYATDNGATLIEHGVADEPADPLAPPPPPPAGGGQQ